MKLPLDPPIYQASTIRMFWLKPLGILWTPKTQGFNVFILKVWILPLPSYPINLLIPENFSFPCPRSANSAPWWSTARSGGAVVPSCTTNWLTPYLTITERWCYSTQGRETSHLRRRLPRQHPNRRMQVTWAMIRKCRQEHKTLAVVRLSLIFVTLLKSMIS